MLVAGLGDTPEAGQAVGLHPGARVEVACGPPSQDGLAEALDAAALATALPAPIDVVHLHDTGQRDALVALTHRLHQLVLQLPGGVLADAELARQLERRDAVLGLRHQMEWSIYEVSDYLGCGSYGSRVVPEVECTS